MDTGKRRELIERIKVLGLPSPDRPLPLVTLEEFFIGNDDYGSIGCNWAQSPGPQFFFEKLKQIRSKSNVQDVLVEVTEVEENDDELGPYSNTVYVYADATLEEIAEWAVDLQPDVVEEHSFRCYYLCWD